MEVTPAGVPEGTGEPDHPPGPPAAREHQGRRHHRHRRRGQRRVCPYCSKRIRRSRAKSFGETLLRFLYFRPYVCRSCGKRSLHFLHRDAFSPRTRKGKLALVFGGFVILCLLVAQWLVENVARALTDPTSP